MSPNHSHPLIPALPIIPIIPITPITPITPTIPILFLRRLLPLILVTTPLFLSFSGRNIRRLTTACRQQHHQAKR